MSKRLDLDLYLYNPDYLCQKYEVEELNASQIAKLIGCTSGAVGDALVRFGILKRTMSQVLLKTPLKPKRKPRKKFSATLHNREWLLKHFWDQGLTASAIARLVGCSSRAAGQAIKKMFRLESVRRSKIRITYAEAHPLDAIQATRPLRPPMKVVEIQDDMRIDEALER